MIGDYHVRFCERLTRKIRWSTHPKGVANVNNIPGGRNGGVSWIDDQDNLWLFGGWGKDCNGNNGYLNDLWKYDGSSWTWVSGNNVNGQSSVYGTKGIPNANNIPSARMGSVSWVDSNGDFWLFSGVDNSGQQSPNDLWKFDGSNWTWIDGGTSGSESYGTKGIANISNIPPGRQGGISWVDQNGIFWLFGGHDNFRNDLWKSDGTNWTWMSGSSSYIQRGEYGTKGTPSRTNVPGIRGWSYSWMDTDGNLWLFGGQGIDENGEVGYLNDLWKISITN